MTDGDAPLRRARDSVRVTRSERRAAAVAAAQCAASHVRVGLYVSTYVFMCGSMRSAAPLVVQRDCLLMLKSTCALFIALTGFIGLWANKKAKIALKIAGFSGLKSSSSVLKSLHVKRF